MSPMLPLPVQWSMWENVSVLANSAFTIALIGSMAGAFAGALAAQRIVERSKVRDELTRETRETNATITLAYAVCQGAIHFKKQLIQPMWTDFEEARKKFESDTDALKATVASVHPKFQIAFEIDFRVLPSQNLPVLDLQERCYEKLSLIGRGLVLPVTITQTLDSINRTVDQRNELVAQYKQEQFSPKKLASLYFGTFGSDESGAWINEEHKNTVHNLHTLTDDLLFFTRLLCEDLRMHGLELAKRFKKTSRAPAPTINEARFGEAEMDGTMPTNETYPSWVNWHEGPGGESTSSPSSGGA